LAVKNPISSKRARTCHWESPLSKVDNQPWADRSSPRLIASSIAAQESASILISSWRVYAPNSSPGSHWPHREGEAPAHVGVGVLGMRYGTAATQRSGTEASQGQP